MAIFRGTDLTEVVRPPVLIGIAVSPSVVRDPPGALPSDADDTILGFGGNDTLDGVGGNNSIDGGSGNDSIRSGEGNDTLVGGTGNDIIDAGFGTDIVDAGDGNDTVSGDLPFTTQGGDDSISGGAGNDSLKGESGFDTIDGGTGDDTLDGGNGDDILLGDAGNDVISGRNGNDSLVGGDGDDVLDGGGYGRTVSSNDSDTLFGGNGNDRLTGGPFLFGGEGDDTISGEGGSNAVAVGGPGADRFYRVGTVTDYTTADLFMAPNVPASRILFLSEFSRFAGGHIDTDVVGQGERATQVTYFRDEFNREFSLIRLIDPVGQRPVARNDQAPTVQASVGQSMLIDVLANDSDSEGRLDTASLTPLTLPVNAQNQVLGLVSVEDGQIRFQWGINIGTGSFTYAVKDLDGNTSNIASVMVTVRGFLPALAGTSGNDRRIGTSSAELIQGLAGNDDLSGGGGNDVIDGGSGRDTINGGTGNDELTGGEGRDSFVLSRRMGNDIVTDFTADEDVLRFSRLKLSQSEVFERLEQRGDNIVINLGSNGSMALINVDAGSLVGLKLAGVGDAPRGTQVFVGDNGDDELMGGDRPDILVGLAGNDSLAGNAGKDILIGGEGDDWLDGGSGGDRLIGGPGNDGYVIGRGDKVIETADGGESDSIFAARATKLADFVENLQLTGTGSINGSGNDADNRIIGNPGANELSGGRGADTIIGGGRRRHSHWRPGC
jgi:Ca2+-binding RTX toxin-like protein